MLPDIKARTEQALARLPAGSWAWVARPNKAAQRYPTDFALLAVQEAQLAAVTAALQQLEGFRDVHPDRRIRGSANWQPEGPLAAAFSDAPAHARQAAAAATTGGGGGPPQTRQQAGGLRLKQEAPRQHTAAAAAAAAALPSRQLLGDDGDGGQAGSSKATAPAPSPAPGSSPVDAEPGQQPAEGQDGAGGGSIWDVSKPPGRLSTRPTIGLDPASKADREAGYNKDELRRRRRGLLAWAADTAAGLLWGGQQEQQQQHDGGSSGRRRLMQDTRVTTLLEAPKLWKQGYSGKGIKV